MLDANLLLRAASAGNLTANETGSWVDFGGPQVMGLSFLIMVPEIEDAADTLDLKIECSDDGAAANGREFHVPQITGASAAGIYRITVRQPSRYLRFDATVGGAPAVDGFGAVVIGPTFGGDQEKF